MTIKRVLREPLLHFFLAGAALFAIYAALDNPEAEAPQEIVVDEARVDALRSNFERTWQRPPSGAELRAMVDSWVNQELLYREGLALGFDRDDPVLKRRIAQKVGFLVDGANAQPPGEEELRAWVDANSERYQVPPTFSFEQLYYDPEQQGEALSQNVAADRAVVEAGGEPQHANPTLLPPTMVRASHDQVTASFGVEFAAALGGAAVGQWSGPISSAFGLHLVRVKSASPGRPATFEEARADAERDFLAERQATAESDLVKRLRKQYPVRMEASLPGEDTGTGTGQP